MTLSYQLLQCGSPKVFSPIGQKSRRQLSRFVFDAEVNSETETEDKTRFFSTTRTKKEREWRVPGL
jgi:hypothetical protein